MLEFLIAKNDQITSGRIPIDITEEDFKEFIGLFKDIKGAIETLKLLNTTVNKAVSTLVETNMKSYFEELETLEGKLKEVTKELDTLKESLKEIKDPHAINICDHPLLDNSQTTSVGTIYFDALNDKLKVSTKGGVKQIPLIPN